MSEGRRKKAGDRGELAAERRARPRSRRRDLLMAAVAVALFFALLETVLAGLGVQPLTLREDPFVGFAGSSPLFVPEAGAGGEPYLVTAPAKLELFNPQRFPRRKRPGTYRIFCLGGSTTFGRPYDDATSFAGWLRELLPVAAPGRVWEVINAGGVSYASYRVARVMHGLGELEPDLFIVYTGQNEFLEERTYRSMRQLPAALKAVAAALSGSRTWAAMDALMTRVGVLAGGPRTREMLPVEVDARLDRAAGLELYERDDALRRRILRHYRVSLERMVGIARSAGAEVILVVPASNLRSCAPFKSQHTPGLDPTRAERSRQLLAEARLRLEAGGRREALAMLDEAAGIDPRFAELHYQRGRALFALGRHDEAKEAFQRALEEDVCPLRAPAEIEAILRRVAAETGSPLVDFEGLLETGLEAAAGHSILGEEDFLDHVHPTVAGHRVLALELLGAIRELGVLPAGGELPEPRLRQVIARVEGGLDPAKRARALAALARTLDWAGKREESRRLAARALESGIEHPAILLMAAKHQALDGDAERARELYRRAVRADPLSPTTHYRMGLFWIQQGDLEAAAAHLLLASVLWPEDAAAHEKLGLVMAERGRHRLALASLAEARRRSPGRPEIGRAMDRVRRVAGAALPEPPPPQVLVERYPSGSPRLVAQARRDAADGTVLHGLLTEWWPDGTIRRVVGYADGAPLGAGASWDRRGERG